MSDLISDTDISKIEYFIATNPDIERIEAIYPTINGIYRGKWVPAADINKLVNGSMRLPISTYALDSWGLDVEASGLGIINGDPDGIGLAVVDTLSRIPWSSAPAAQVIMTMVLRDNEASPCPYDPRQQLSAVVKRFTEHGLTPVIATELEFYLLKPTNLENPRLQPFRELTTGNLNDLDQMQEFEPVLNEIRRACEAQNVLADVMIAESGMCQFEINFKHVNDPLRAADQAMLFKRIVKGCAKMHGMEATFMAKPFGEDLGSGMHVHVSVLDSEGNNIFDGGENASAPADNLRHATGGLLATMVEMQAIFTPNLNSFRRLHSGSFAPNQVNWGLDHRAAAVRLPEISGPASRLEHRICGADANPYLVLTSILAGMLHGLDHQIDPGEPLDSTEDTTWDNAAFLHKDWTATIDDFAASQIAEDTFGSDFHRVYCILCRHEIGQLVKMVTDVELRLYLHSA